jgi:hypothetical protein
MSFLCGLRGLSEAGVRLFHFFRTSKVGAAALAVAYPALLALLLIHLCNDFWLS